MKKLVFKRGLMAAALLSLSSVLMAQQQQDQGMWASFEVRYLSAQTDPNPETQAAMRKQDAWQNFVADRGQWYVVFDEYSALPRRASGPAFELDGSTPEDKVYNFLVQSSLDWPIPLSDLVLRGSHTHGKFHYVDYSQRYAGLPVLDSRSTFRLSLDGRLVMFGHDLFPGIEVNTVPSLSPEAAALAAGEGIPFLMTSSQAEDQLAILPILGERGLEYRLVYQINSHFEPVNGIPGHFHALVDARSGEVLSRQARVHECSHMLTSDIDVEASITDNPGLTPEVRGLPYVRVEVGGVNYYTDANGAVNIPSITVPETATVYLQGLYARVFIGASSTALTSFTTTVNPGVNVIDFDPHANARQVSAYYHTNIIYDFMKGYFPAFTALDFPFTIRVDRTDGSCNAFYDGSSINFYTAGGGCPATALFSDVVYHEYGHGLNYDVYEYFGDFSGMNNGAMQEGYADIWGLSISEDPILGLGFSGGSSFVRRYDVSPKVYPEDLVGQVHADGEIIAGAWWDLGVLFGSVPDMTDLWLATFPATVDGPSGTEGVLYSNVLLEALLQDDDDFDLSNGTPRDEDILAAFAIHGITLLANVDLEYAVIAADVTEPIQIEAELEVDFEAYIGDVNVFWKRQNEPFWVELTATATGSGLFSANIDPQPAGTVLEFYFEVNDIYGSRALIKPNKAERNIDPNLAYFHLVGYNLHEQEDFDNFSGDWVLDPYGTDDVTSGAWEINRPQLSLVGTGVVQPGKDYSPDNDLDFCLVTGANGYTSSSPVNFDIDNGETTVRSPAFDATAYENPVFSYYRWFSNDRGANPGNDPFEVFISNDGSTWNPVRNTFTSDASWRRDIIRISDYVAATPTVYLLFVASDRIISSEPSSGQSLVEALVDDLFLYDLKEVEDPTSGLDADLLSTSMQLMPNPSSGAFQVVLSGGLNAEYLEVISPEGRRIWSSAALDHSGSIEQVITVPDGRWSSGLYTVRIKTQQGWAVQRVVIER